MSRAKPDRTIDLMKKGLRPAAALEYAAAADRTIDLMKKGLRRIDPGAVGAIVTIERLT